MQKTVSWFRIKKKNLYEAVLSVLDIHLFTVPNAECVHVHHTRKDWTLKDQRYSIIDGNNSDKQLKCIKFTQEEKKRRRHIIISNVSKCHFEVRNRLFTWMPELLHSADNELCLNVYFFPSVDAAFWRDYELLWCVTGREIRVYT